MMPYRTKGKIFEKTIEIKNTVMISFIANPLYIFQGQNKNIRLINPPLLKSGTKLKITIEIIKEE